MADGSGPLHAAHASAWLTPLLGAIGGICAAALVWLGQRMIGKAAFQTALNDGFAKFTQELQEELQASRTERAALRVTLETERIQTAGERADLRGEIMNLTQVIEGLKGILRLHGIPVPAGRPPLTVENPPPAMIIIGGSFPPSED